MMLVDNLDDGELRDLIRRIEDLERGTPLNNASIGRSGLTVYDGGVITIENGGLSITGTAEVIGQLIGSGVLAWMGDVAFSGDVDLIGTTTVSGPLNIIGDVDITKTLDITGATTLASDMTVTGAGKITVGNMKIGEGTHGDGKGVSFTNGGALAARANVVEVYAATGGLLSAGTAQTSVTFNGNGAFVDASGIKLAGLAPKTGVTANIHMDAQGRLWKVG